jgi:hypothetical protein
LYQDAEQTVICTAATANPGFNTFFLHENVQTEAVSIQFKQVDANRGHFYSNFGH